jgi:DNA-binding response OmpR family regulator
MCALEPMSYRVLIVEDTPEMAELMQDVLTRLGVQHVHCADGPTALNYLSGQSPDLLLLDIGLPGMSGWEVLDNIRERYPHAAYPVIVLTAFSDPVNKLVGKLHNQVSHYVTKPFHPRELTGLVRDLLQLPVD